MNELISEHQNIKLLVLHYFIATKKTHKYTHKTFDLQLNFDFLFFFRWSEVPFLKKRTLTLN